MQKNVDMKAIPYFIQMKTEAAKVCLREGKIYCRASALGLSAGYLHTIFKNVNGISIVEFINQYRINLAKQYILNQNMPLNEISAQVGISDPAYMSRLFKKIVGISYRQFCKKKGNTGI